MKNLELSLFMICFLMIGTPVAEAVVTVKPTKTETTVTTSKQQLNKKEARKQRRLKKKAVRQEVKQAIRDWKKEGDTDTDTLLLVIIAILIPPLAMAIYDGITGRFWLSLLLTLLFYLPGLIYTLVVILGRK